MASKEYQLDSKDFTFLRFLGEGSFGEVQKCLKTDTGEIVAAKIPREKYRSDEEVGHFVDCDVYLTECIVKSTASSA